MYNPDKADDTKSLDLQVIDQQLIPRSSKVFDSFPSRQRKIPLCDQELHLVHSQFSLEIRISASGKAQLRI